MLIAYARWSSNNNIGDCDEHPTTDGEQLWCNNRFDCKRNCVLFVGGKATGNKPDLFARFREIKPW